jgi:predicted nucleic-acid-binding Zn-ribbon protein
MKETKICPKCDSNFVIYPLETMGYPTSSIKVLVPPKRAFLSLNTPDTFSLQAAVCGHCGYTELYVSEPKRLNDAWENKE